MFFKTSRQFFIRLLDSFQESADGDELPDDQISEEAKGVIARGFPQIDHDNAERIVKALLGVVNGHRTQDAVIALSVMSGLALRSIADAHLEDKAALLEVFNLQVANSLTLNATDIDRPMFVN
jgi:hypothetical protein